MVIAALKCHGLLNAAQGQGEHESASRGELLHPGRRDVPGAYGEDDPIVRRLRWMAKPPVPTKHFDPREPRSSKMLPGCHNEILVNVDGDDVAVFAHNLSD